jgi:hypothetical protein
VLVRIIITGFLFLVLCTINPSPSNALRVIPNKNRNVLVTNETLIRGLHHASQMDDRLSVFRYVFSSMDDEVTVYPTENYYYFEFALGGVLLKGNIGLLAHNRDAGLVSFSYREDYAVTDINHKPLSRELSLTAQDGVYLKKLSDFKYTISFEGKTVIFNLNDIGLAPPRKATLSVDETFVGPSFDESGLQFYLIYNKKCQTLFWILNEDDSVLEQFLSYTSELLIGRRTEFAFYDDKDNNRKILIGVKESNMIRNTWYDGPFDQLPDNYIKNGSVELQKYIEASYQDAKGEIDKYGIFLDKKDARIAIIPYVNYSSKDELVKLIDALRASPKSRTDFYCKLTKARYVDIKPR